MELQGDEAGQRQQQPVLLVGPVEVELELQGDEARQRQPVLLVEPVEV